MGLAARRLLNKRKLSQAEQALEMATNSISADAVSPPLAVETWFNAPGRFMFGLPQTFRYCDLKTKRWPQGLPLLAVEDGSTNSGMFLSVLDVHLSVEITEGHSVWVTVVNAEAYRHSIRSWGGTVTTGPVPILVTGERGVWSVIDSIEQGQHIRRWSVLTMHAGAPYEVLMGLGREDERACADAFWTAIGSWRWADMVDEGNRQSADSAQSSNTVDSQAGPIQVQGQAGMLSPDGQWYWDGAAWKPAITPDGRWRWSGHNWVANQPSHTAVESSGSESWTLPAAPVDDSEEWRRIATAVEALQVSPTTSPLRPESWFSFPGEFSFGLPRNFGVPSHEVIQLWESRNGAALVCAEDAEAGDYAVFLMVQRDGELVARDGEIRRASDRPWPEGNSLWVSAVVSNDFRERATRRGMHVVRGPEPILIGGERAIFFVHSQVDDGVDTRHWCAMVIHRGKGYDVTMFVKASAEAHYADAFLTAMGSWSWANEQSSASTLP